MDGGVVSLSEAMGWDCPVLRAGDLLNKVVYISDAEVVQTKFGERVLFTLLDENFANPVRVFLIPNKLRMRLVDCFKTGTGISFIGPVKITKNGSRYNIIPA